MNQTPTAGPRTAGRVYGTDWSIANVATLLRSHAGRGVWHRTTPAGGYAAKSNQHYLQTVSALHLPTNVSLILMQLEDCWQASLCFCTEGEFAPWNDEVAELWLRALFGQDRPAVRTASDGEAPLTPSVRNFTLARA
jgi:hypothetical protein